MVYLTEVTRRCSAYSIDFYPANGYLIEGAKNENKTEHCFLLLEMLD